MYYIIKNALDDEIVGKAYPQVDCLTPAQAHLISAWKLFDPEPKLKFKLKKKSILTNVLSDATIGSTGFLIDKFTLSIMTSFKLMRHQLFEAPVSFNGKELEYSWLHLTEPELTKKLDYNHTIFYRTEYTFREEPIELQSYQHYELLKKQDKDASFGVELDKIVLAKEFDHSLDMFTFLPFDNNIYISEQMKEALDPVTGIEIIEAKSFMM